MQKYKAKDLLKMDPYTLKRAAQTGGSDMSQAKQIFRALKNTLDSRIRTYAKHGASSKVPDNIMNIGGVKGKTKSQLIKDIRQMSSFMRNPEKGTYAKYEKAREKRRASISRGTGVQIRTPEEEDKLDEFLKKARERYADDSIWKNGGYQVAFDMFDAARNLSLNPDQFLRNFEYWEEHLSDLENAEPIKSGRKLYPSDYARKLNLPKISSGSKPKRKKSRSRGKLRKRK